MLATVKAVPGPAGEVKKPGFSQTMLVVIILAVVLGAVVAVVAASLFLGPSLSVTTKNFTPYQSSVSPSSNPSSMTVSNTNGGVTVSSWSQAYLMVNGTVTGRGFGSSPDAITFVESNSSGNIVFQAIFPASNFFFGASYSVDIHVYAPASAQFNTVQIVTVNGDLQVSSILPISERQYQLMLRNIQQRGGLDVRRNEGKFVVQKFGDEGTGTPFMARIFYGQMKLAEALDAADRAAFLKVHKPLMTTAMEIRDAAKDVARTWKDFKRRIDEGSIVERPATSR